MLSHHFANHHCLVLDKSHRRIYWKGLGLWGQLMVNRQLQQHNILHWQLLFEIKAPIMPLQSVLCDILLCWDRSCVYCNVYCRSVALSS
jgi:hypothetical protein